MAAVIIAVSSNMPLHGESQIIIVMHTQKIFFLKTIHKYKPNYFLNKNKKQPVTTLRGHSDSVGVVRIERR